MECADCEMYEQRRPVWAHRAGFPLEVETTIDIRPFNAASNTVAYCSSS